MPKEKPEMLMDQEWWQKYKVRDYSTSNWDESCGLSVVVCLGMGFGDKGKRNYGARVRLENRCDEEV